MVWQPFFGSRTRNCGLRPPPPSSLVRSKSTASSQATFVPIVPGQAPPGFPRPSVIAGGDKARLYVSSYQRPVVTGEPPVTSEASPGNESDGVELKLLVYVTPWRLRA